MTPNLLISFNYNNNINCGILDTKYQLNLVLEIAPKVEDLQFLLGK